MNKILLKLLFISCFSISYCQSNPILEMAKSMSLPETQITDLNNFVSENITDKEQIAKFFFYWISINIEYDFEKRERTKEVQLTEKELDENANPQIVFNEKKALCIGYSNLFKSFMDKFEIDCLIITGHAKTTENLTLELELDDDFLHAWNAIKINEKWILIDSTWAREFNGEISDFYFNTSPEQFIFTHYPFDQGHQFLEKPLSITEFNEIPYISFEYFQSGYSQKPTLSSDENYYYLEFQKNPNKRWLIKLTYSSDNVNFESVYPDYIDKPKSFIYKFKRELTPKETYISIVLTDFNQKRQTMKFYEKAVLFQL